MKISSFGRKEMTLDVKSNKECDSVEETPIENNFLEDSTKKEEFLVKEGVKYVIQERSKKLNILQKLRMKKQLFKQHVRNVLKKYMTGLNVNIALLLMFLFRFNKNMLCFVCFIKIATEFNKLISKNSDLMDSITHTGKTMVYFVSSLFLIDHHMFFTRQQKTDK